MVLVRYFLIGLIVYLLVRALVRATEEKGSSTVSGNETKGPGTGKKISKDTGDYVDYEELKK